ncbi:MAG TPA: prepilin-type N-terminal cleavage/methylation domain-containing protein, partial [Clostridiaceae bacterium]|nr:prepilin-type N-terminal cleavage/methylation domain-containing protein [Clostridiaceae bacterium]
MKIMAKNEKNEKGFTLVELMVVVAIIGVLTAIAVPVYNNSQRKARFNAHLANVRILQG